MSTALTISACVIIWLYSVIATRNGGGPGAAVGVIATCALSIVGWVYFFATGQLLYSWLVLGGIFTLFAINLFINDDDFLLN